MIIPEDVDVDDDDLSSFTTLRERAVAAFRNVRKVNPDELVCAAFRPLLEARINSDSWPEKEAAILALCSFTFHSGQCYFS